MRKASIVLGIISGVIAIIIALVIFLGSLAITQTLPAALESELDTSEFEDYDYDYDVSESIGIAGAVFAGYGGLFLLGGILGIVGVALVTKHNVVAGVLMLLGSVLLLITIWGFLLFIMLLLGGIFALVEDKNAPTQPTFSPDFE